ncbi:MAG: hypothetical protein H6712_13670 [Myxococcales bacterium]|nr:hypothetical protein [Myxococcales bacterium]
MRDFAGEAAELEALKATQRDVAVARLRALHEVWARAVLGLDAQGELVARTRAVVEAGLDPSRASEAIDHLAAAEQHQWEIGSWSSGAGEGLASMLEVRTLQLARAWLLPTHERHARELLEAVADDPNRIAERLRPHIDALAARLGGRPR